MLFSSQPETKTVSVCFLRLEVLTIIILSCNPSIRLRLIAHPRLMALRPIRRRCNINSNRRLPSQCPPAHNLICLPFIKAMRDTSKSTNPWHSASAMPSPLSTPTLETPARPPLFHPTVKHKSTTATAAGDVLIPDLTTTTSILF